MLMSMRSISATEAGCSTSSTLLQQLHHVFGAIPLALQLFLDLDGDETNGVVLQRDRNRHVLQRRSSRRGQHRQPMLQWEGPPTTQVWALLIPPR